ncbi:NAD(P)H-binding protein [Dactylosporangium darangshiense]|uniref:NAD(P)H-binding protein n=1 Tax=Dactylosporangium darangshiense TaxID=579108 RepID=UPI00363BE9F0
MILVTGANGNLGSAMLAALHARGAIATGSSRTPSRKVRRLDFDDPSGIDLSDVSTLVLISAGYAEDDQVIGRHATVLDAATRDGVRHVIYTSLTGAGDHLSFALAHRATERLVRACGLPWTVLRNGLYAELFGGLLIWADGGVESPFDDGAVAAVARADLAEAAAIIAAAPAQHSGRTYDLVGTPITAAHVAGRLESRTGPSAWASTGAGSSTGCRDCCRSSRRCSLRLRPGSGTASWATPVPTSLPFSAARFVTRWLRLSRPRLPADRRRPDNGGQHTSCNGTGPPGDRPERTQVRYHGTCTTSPSDPVWYRRKADRRRPAGEGTRRACIGHRYD